MKRPHSASGVTSILRCLLNVALVLGHADGETKSSRRHDRLGLTANDFPHAAVTIPYDVHSPSLFVRSHARNVVNGCRLCSRVGI